MSKTTPLVTDLAETSPFLKIYDNTRFSNAEDIPNQIYNNIDSSIGAKNGYINVLDGPSNCIVNDKSLKSSIDVLLHPFINLLRSQNCITTSSCSGRIAILAKNTVPRPKKNETLFLNVSHSHIGAQKPNWIESVDSSSPFYAKQKSKLSPDYEIILKYEPFVIHIEFDNLKQASLILELAKTYGLKQSGLISVRKRIILALRGSQHFEVPIAKSTCGNIVWLMTSDVINYYLLKCNEKHTTNILSLVEFYWILYYNPNFIASKQLIEIKELNDYNYLKRWGSSSCMMNDKLYLFGGYISESNPPLLSVYSINKSKWSNIHLNDSIESVFSCIFPLDDNKLVIVMGRSNPNSPSDKVYIIDISLDYKLIPVETSANGPKPRFRHAVAKGMDNTFYMFGGVTHGYEYLGDLWKGSIIKDDVKYYISWVKLNDCPVSIASSSMHYHSNTIYILGGLSNSYQSNFMNKIWSYDLNKSKWSLITTDDLKYPENRISHGSVKIGNSILLVGGISINECAYGMMLFDIWMFGLDELKWYYLGEISHDIILVKSSIEYDPVSQTLYVMGGGVVCFTFGTVFQKPISVKIQLENSESLNGAYLKVNQSNLVDSCKDFCKNMGWLNDSNKVVFRNNTYLIPVNIYNSELLNDVDLNSQINILANEFISDYLIRHNIKFTDLNIKLKFTKFERLGHILLFDNDLITFNNLLVDNKLDRSALDIMYEQLTKVISRRIKGIKAIGVKGIVEGEIRKPNVQLFYGGPITQFVENGITYVLDVTKCMFSAGNVNERIRIPTKYLSDDHFELIVDMFCGIGYFSLPILSMTKSCKLVVSDINEEALKFFKKGLEINFIDVNRVDVISGDCRNLIDTKYIGSADRILSGLLPDSSVGWEPAVILAHKHKPCIIHIHILSELIGSPDKLQFTAISTCLDFPSESESNKIAPIDDLLYKMYKIVRNCVDKGIITHKELSILNVVKVKNYSPYQAHYVIDLKLTPIDFNHF